MLAIDLETGYLHTTKVIPPLRQLSGILALVDQRPVDDMMRRADFPGIELVQAPLGYPKVEESSFKLQIWKGVRNVSTRKPKTQCRRRAVKQELRSKDADSRVESSLLSESNARAVPAINEGREGMALMPSQRAIADLGYNTLEQSIGARVARSGSSNEVRKCCQYG